MKNKEEALLRSIIREFVEAYAVRGGSQPDESYDKELLDDEAFDASSVLVPDDIKKKIKKWAKDMKLST
jgi:hypothetical protein